jgi:hypothetical protein
LEDTVKINNRWFQLCASACFDGSAVLALGASIIAFSLRASAAPKAVAGLKACATGDDVHRSESARTGIHGRVREAREYPRAVHA